MSKLLLLALWLLFICAGCASSDGGRKIIYPPGAKSGGRFSPGILFDDTLYISGMGGEDASGNVPADFEAEVKQTLENIDAVLIAAGMTSDNVVSVQVYLTDGSTFQQMNNAYTAYFQEPRPTRTTVVVAKLVVPGHIEITATAKK
jgi:2-iminobutanoate/2-iminopropanoate deaminase